MAVFEVEDPTVETITRRPLKAYFLRLGDICVQKIKFILKKNQVVMKNFM